MPAPSSSHLPEASSSPVDVEITVPDSVLKSTDSRDFPNAVEAGATMSEWNACETGNVWQRKFFAWQIARSFPMLAVVPETTVCLGEL